MAPLGRLILLAVFLVAGCSSTSSRIWQRQDTSSDQTQADEAVCIRPASGDPGKPGEGQANAAGNQQTVGTATRARQGRIDACMEGKGYRLDRANAAEPVR